nr:MAG TPA: hypothetical protein [Caudoviricetes sp.]
MGRESSIPLQASVGRLLKTHNPMSIKKLTSKLTNSNS